MCGSGHFGQVDAPNFNLQHYMLDEEECVTLKESGMCEVKLYPFNSATVYELIRRLHNLSVSVSVNASDATPQTRNT